jgi:hypothetical protein
MYSEGYFPDTFRVGEMVLRQMTLGHALMLERLESPFAPWRPVTARIGAGGIALFVEVMTRGWRDAARSLNRDGWWRRRRARRLAVRVLSDPRASATVEKYLAAQVNVPNATHWQRDDMEPSGAEMTHSLMVVLMGQLGHTREEAMDTPLRLALWDQMALQEQNGTVSLESDGSPKVEAKQRAIRSLEARLRCQTKP